VTLPVRMYMLATEIDRPDDGGGVGADRRPDGAVMLVLDRLYGLDKVLVGQK
jgi:putative spermidine/putrescine transport system permease protein